MIYNSPLALAALAIAGLALLFGIGLALGALAGSSPAALRGRLREALLTVLCVLALCGIAVLAVTQGLAR